MKKYERNKNHYISDEDYVNAITFWITYNMLFIIYVAYQVIDFSRLKLFISSLF